MRGRHSLNRSLDNDLLVHERVEAIAGVQSDVVIDDRQRDLPKNLASARKKFMRETVLVCGLQQARSQRLVNLQPGIDDRPRRLINSCGNLLVSLVLLVVHSAKVGRGGSVSQS